MFFWFAATAVLAVWYVFRDPGFDYRLLVVGAILPAIVDGAFGGARALHSVTVSVAVLAVLMVATPRGSARRRMLLGLPIGMLLHLVFTGAWTSTDSFWWPFTGFGFGGAPHPVAARGWWNLPLELIGLGLCWWIVERTGLRRADRRRRFRTTGQLSFPSTV